ncbi:hypothetical protein FKO01_04205 [Mesorhizobium sp. B2-3-3]|nr:hypothetical protein FKO01_04205 [Mesorhizobium sp. B2-3-3]
MNISRLLSGAAATCCVLTSGATYAQQDTAGLVKAMNGISASWQAISANGEVLLISCANGKFAGVRLAPGASVSVDLRKTDSLMNPYVGIVQIYGRYQFSSSQQDGSCYLSKKEAVSPAVPWRDNDMNYSYVIYYQVNGSEMQLTNGNGVFVNNFMTQPGKPQVDANSNWLHVFRYSVQ